MEYFNQHTMTTASVMGVLPGLGGIINHGIFEILQGNKSTGGFFIDAIGEGQRFWLHGTEAAFTVIHNYLVTGIVVVLVGLAIITWSLKYLQTKHGATVFLLLLMLLTLVGGGIGHIILSLPTWAFATQIRKPLSGWQRRLPASSRKTLAALWGYGLAATVLTWLTVMELGIFGYFPGQDDPDMILTIVFVFLFSSAILACITFICAIAKDIEKKIIKRR